MRNNVITNLLVLGLILLGTQQLQSQVSSASPKKTNHIGLHFITPLASGNVQSTEALLLPGTKSILTDYSINNSIGLSYTTIVPTKTFLVSSVEGGFQMSYLSGSTTSERINTSLVFNPPLDQLVLSRSQLNFQNVFLGSSVKLRKSILPSNRLELIAGIEINGRVWNKLSRKSDMFFLDNSTGTPTTSAIDEPSSFRSIDIDKNLIFVQVNVGGGLAVNQFLHENLSFEVLFNYSALQINNHGHLRVNPVMLGLKYKL